VTVSQAAKVASAGGNVAVGSGDGVGVGWGMKIVFPTVSASQIKPGFMSLMDWTDTSKSTAMPKQVSPATIM
jgi:hypothetical protein